MRESSILRCPVRYRERRSRPAGHMSPMDESRHDRTPRALRDAAAIAWRALGAAAAVAGALYLLATLRLIFLPVVVALLLSTVLAPPAGWLKHRGWPGTAATLAVFAGSLLLVAGSVTLLAPSVAGELEDLNLNLRDGLDQVEEWGTDWVGISESRVDSAVEQAEEAVTGS